MENYSSGWRGQIANLIGRFAMREFESHIFRLILNVLLGVFVRLETRLVVYIVARCCGGNQIKLNTRKVILM